MTLDGPSIAYSALLLAGLVQAANWIAPVRNLSDRGCAIEYVYDGDTVSVACDGAVETARLVGFDTPETKDPGCTAEQTLGDQATLRLRDLVRRGPVTMSGGGYDKYGRQLVRLYVGGTDVGETLIAEGLAVSYTGGLRINWCDRLGNT